MSTSRFFQTLTSAVMLLVLTACSLLPTPPQATPTGGFPTPTPRIVPLSNPYPPPFAGYPAITVRVPTAPLPGYYTLPLDLSTVQGMENYEFSESQLDLLARNGFVVIPAEAGTYREFYQVYERSRYSLNPVYITTDSVFHIYHLIFDKMLRDLERDSFIPALEDLTASLLETTADQYDALLGTSLEEPALRNVAYFGVADRLLGLNDNIPSAADALVEAELALINAAAGQSISPIWERPDLPPDDLLIEDYSQYIPRGHYTRSEELERYFRTMMWYGRLTFRLNDAFETRRALLMTLAIRSTGDAETLWQNIYDPTVFIVGKSDDLSFYEYGAISDAVFGTNPNPAAFADETLFAAFMQQAESLPPPQVNSMWVWIWQDAEAVTKGLRFMGQRFTLDEYVFGQVMWRRVGTLDNPRDLPKALDLFAAMGSDEAYSILDGMGETAYENYITRMEKVQGEVASLSTESWTQNVYWSWLYAFQPVIAPKGQAYPPFMQTQSWERKQLNTALGSYTELKHDTILYAKQVVAEMGGGAPDQPPPHSYLEADPEAFARLRALALMTAAGLEERDLLSETTRTNLGNLTDLLAFLQTTAEAQLLGEPISEDDYWRMLYIGGEMEALTLAAADTTDALDRDLSDQKAALVADIATGIGRVLEEAIGEPMPIYVVLPDEPYRIAIGAVYSYYEFTVNPSGRMTDEAWQALLETGNAPPLPEWTGMFVAQ